LRESSTASKRWRLRYQEGTESSAVFQHYEMEPQFERRYRLWQDIHRLFWERVPFLLYGDVFNLTGMHKHVQGPFDMPSWYFWNVWLDK
jgi:hypothetical protein